MRLKQEKVEKPIKREREEPDYAEEEEEEDDDDDDEPLSARYRYLLP